VPPHLSSRLLRDVHLGSQVKVRGVRPRVVQIGCPAARSIRQIESLIFFSSRSAHPRRTIASREGEARSDDRPRYRQQLIHGPEERLNARCCAGGTGRIIRLPLHEAGRFADLLQEGAQKSQSVAKEPRRRSGRWSRRARSRASIETLKPVGQRRKPKHEPGHKGPSIGREKTRPQAPDPSIRSEEHAP